VGVDDEVAADAAGLDDGLCHERGVYHAERYADR
jgi:hypothetical protein